MNDQSKLEQMKIKPKMPSVNKTDQNIFLKARWEKGEFLIAFFNAKRQSELKVPNGINKVDLKKKYGLNEKVSHQFLQYIVNLKADRSFARDSNEDEVVAQIDQWFERFENRLKIIFEPMRDFYLSDGITEFR